MKKDTQEEEFFFSREPEVGVVIAKTTLQYQVNSTWVPNQKAKKKKPKKNKEPQKKKKFKKPKKALTVIGTILLPTRNIFQQSVTQWSPSINN